MKITVIALDHPEQGLCATAAANEGQALAWLRGYYESEFEENTDHIADAQLEAYVAQAGGYRTTISEHDVEVPLYPPRRVGIDVPQYLRGLTSA